MPMLRFIKRQLRLGKHPRDFDASECGDGGQRVAYLFGDYVIKAIVPGWYLDTENNEFAVPCRRVDMFAVPTRTFRRIGVQPPKQWYVGPWVIQPFYMPLTGPLRQRWADEAERDHFYYIHFRQHRHRVKLDLHPQNLGVHPQTGVVHAFDW
jgi:hypothetical protein